MKFGENLYNLRKKQKICMLINVEKCHREVIN